MPKSLLAAYLKTFVGVRAAVTDTIDRHRTGRPLITGSLARHPAWWCDASDWPGYAGLQWNQKDLPN